MNVLVAQSCPTLCNPVDCNPPGSSVHGIFQARILEWVVSSFSTGSSWPKDLSWPRDPTRVSRIAGRCFTIWAIKEGEKGDTDVLEKLFKNEMWWIQDGHKLFATLLTERWLIPFLGIYTVLVNFLINRIWHKGCSQISKIGHRKPSELHLDPLEHSFYALAATEAVHFSMLGRNHL